MWSNQKVTIDKTSKTSFNTLNHAVSIYVAILNCVMTLETNVLKSSTKLIKDTEMVKRICTYKGSLQVCLNCWM
eukprot:m.73191 g.73191  ORF g.73191 m.73191 type:complete len:74 (-) comp12388_c0_seq3:568-789(-)